MKKALALVITSLAISGCASQNQLKQENRQSTQQKESLGSIYAKLEQTPNGYEFTSYALGDAPDSGPWVSIRNDQPLWDTSTENCITGLARKHLRCSSADEALFRYDASMSAGQAGGWAFLTVLSFGLWGTMPPARVMFDEELFQQRYSEAYGKLSKGITVNPKLLIQEADLNLSDLEQLKRSVTFDIETSNQTGFDFPSLRPHDLNISIEGRKSQEYRKIGDLTRYLDEVSIAVTGKENFDNVFTFSCPSSMASYSVESSFDVDINCGEMSFNTAKNRLEVPASVNVLKKKNLYLYPKNLVAKDSAINIEANGKEVVFVNKSSAYLYVKNFSFYHNGMIYTKTWQSPEAIPPDAQKHFGLDSLINNVSSKVTRIGSARSINQSVNVNFSVAASYEQNGQEKSITGKKSYRKIADLIALNY